jgi:ribonuclease P protein component
MDYSLGKKERLSSKIMIARLFKEGKHFYKFPFKVIFLGVEKDKIANNAILVSVSKRNFRKAVDRNRIKRLIREAYRLNKHILGVGEGEKQTHIIIAFIYTAGSILSFKEIERKIILILQSIKKQDEVSAV